MAVQNPAVFLQAGSYPAEDIRRFISSLLGDRPGIVAPGDLAVTQTATASMSVAIAGGRTFLPGTEFAYQGLYFAENRGTDTRALAPADSTNDRFDLVVALVLDEAYSGTASKWDLQVVPGTASPTPVEPDVPANALVLAKVTVHAGADKITDADIEDRRLSTPGQGHATALGARVPVWSQAQRDALAAYPGLEVYRLDTGAVETYTASGWAVAFQPGVSSLRFYGSASGDTNGIVYPASGTAEERVTTAAFNKTATLVAGRAYKVKARGVLNAGAANSNVTMNVRGRAGTGTVTTADKVVGTDRQFIPAAGSQGRTDARLGGLFTVSSTGTYSFALFLWSTVAVVTLLADDRGVADWWLEDAGPAPAGLPSL